MNKLYLLLDYIIHVWYKCLPTMRDGVMLNKIVLHFLNGGIAKGSTLNLSFDNRLFHYTDKNTNEIILVDPRKLKGVFFVRSYDGNPGYQERYDIERAGLGLRVMVTFKDGETLIGYTPARFQGGTGFFLFVPDANSNNERVFILKAATKEVLLS